MPILAVAASQGFNRMKRSYLVVAKSGLPQPPGKSPTSHSLGIDRVSAEGCADDALLMPGRSQSLNQTVAAANGGGAARSKRKNRGSTDATDVSAEEFYRGIIGTTAMPLLPPGFRTAGYPYREASSSAAVAKQHEKEDARFGDGKKKRSISSSASVAPAPAVRRVRYTYGRRARRRRSTDPSKPTTSYAPAAALKLFPVELLLRLGGRRFSRKTVRKNVRRGKQVKRFAGPVPALPITHSLFGVPTDSTAFYSSLEETQLEQKEKGIRHKNWKFTVPDALQGYSHSLRAFKVGRPKFGILITSLSALALYFLLIKGGVEMNPGPVGTGAGTAADFIHNQDWLDDPNFVGYYNHWLATLTSSGMPVVIPFDGGEVHISNAQQLRQEMPRLYAISVSQAIINSAPPPPPPLSLLGSLGASAETPTMHACLPPHFTSASMSSMLPMGLSPDQLQQLVALSSLPLQPMLPAFPPSMAAPTYSQPQPQLMTTMGSMQSALAFPLVPSLPAHVSGPQFALASTSQAPPAPSHFVPVHGPESALLTQSSAAAHATTNEAMNMSAPQVSPVHPGAQHTLLDLGPGMLLLSNELHMLPASNDVGAFERSLLQSAAGDNEESFPFKILADLNAGKKVKYHGSYGILPAMGSGQRQIGIQPSENVLLGNHGDYAYVFGIPSTTDRNYLGSVHRPGIKPAQKLVTCDMEDANGGSQRLATAYLVPVSFGFSLSELTAKGHTSANCQKKLVEILQKGAGVVHRAFNYRSTKSIGAYKVETRPHKFAWSDEFSGFKARFKMGHCSSLSVGCKSSVRIYIAEGEVQHCDGRWYRDVVVEYLEGEGIVDNDGRHKLGAYHLTDLLCCATSHTKPAGRVDAITKAQKAAILQAPGGAMMAPRDVAIQGAFVASPASRQHRSVHPETSTSISQARHAKEDQRATEGSFRPAAGNTQLTTTKQIILDYQTISALMVDWELKNDPLPTLEILQLRLVKPDEQKYPATQTFFELRRQTTTTVARRAKFHILSLDTLDSMILTPASLCAGFAAGQEGGICVGDHFKCVSLKRSGSNWEVVFGLYAVFPLSRSPAAVMMLTFTQGQDAKSLTPAFRALRDAYADLLRDLSEGERFPFKCFQTDCDTALGNAWVEVFCKGYTVSTYNTVAELLLLKDFPPPAIAKIQGPPWLWDNWHFIMAPKETIKQKCVAAKLSAEVSSRMWKNSLGFGRRLVKETSLLEAYALFVSFITFAEAQDLIVPHEVSSGEATNAEHVFPSSKHAPPRMIARVGAADGLRIPEGYTEISLDTSSRVTSQMQSVVNYAKDTPPFRSSELQCEDLEPPLRSVEELATSTPLEEEEDGDAAEEDLAAHAAVRARARGRLAVPVRLVERVAAKSQPASDFQLASGHKVSLDRAIFTGRYVIYKVEHGRHNVIVAREMQSWKEAEGGGSYQEWYVKSYPDGKAYKTVAREVDGLLYLTNPFAEAPGLEITKLWLKKAPYLLQFTAVMRQGINTTHASAGSAEGMNNLVKNGIFENMKKRAAEYGLPYLCGSLNMDDPTKDLLRVADEYRVNPPKRAKIKAQLAGAIDGDTRQKLGQVRAKNLYGLLSNNKAAGGEAYNTGAAVEAEENQTDEADYIRSYVPDKRDLDDLVRPLSATMKRIVEKLKLKDANEACNELLKTVKPFDAKQLDLTLANLCHGDAQRVDVDAIIAAIPNGMGLLRAAWWLFARKSAGRKKYFNVSQLQKISNSVEPQGLGIYAWCASSAARLILLAFVEVMKETPEGQDMILQANHNRFLKRMWQKVGYLQHKLQVHTIDPDVGTGWWLPPPCEDDVARPTSSTATGLSEVQRATGVSPLMQSVEITSREEPFAYGGEEDIIPEQARNAAAAAAQAAAAQMVAPAKVFPSGKSRGRPPKTKRGGRGGSK